jgi:hypothetical protein
MENQRLKVVFLVGSDSPSTRLSIEQVCLLPGVEPVAVLLDSEVVSLKRRFKNLSRNIRANGWNYVLIRFFEAIRSVTDTAVMNAAVSRVEVMDVLRKAFPERCFFGSEQESVNTCGFAGFL